MIHLRWEVAARPLPDKEVERTVERALEYGQRSGIELSVAFVSDAALARVHAEFMGDPSPTDVISFDLSDGGPGPQGELLVSVECALRVAAERGVSPGRELALYLVHGVLHLCGYDDHDPEERQAMRRAETEVLDSLGMPGDPLPHDRGE